MSKEVENITKLSRDSIIQLALKSINRTRINKAEIENFAKIRVLIENGEEVWVSFSNPIKYLSKESVFYFDVGTSILGGISSFNSLSNGLKDDNTEAITFFKLTEEIKMNIRFVLESINKSKEIGGSWDITNIEEEMTNYKDEMIIRENENYYQIIVESSSQVSSYKIEKISGKIYDVGHEHLIPPPIELIEKNTEEIFEEVKAGTSLPLKKKNK